MNTARPIAWTAFVGGTAASVAANVTHAYLSNPDHSIGPQIAAAFWPLALLAALEVITRVPWPSGWLWTLARYGGTGAVALGAALLSYRHMASLLALWGEDPVNAHVGPLVVDGLMVVAGTALLALSTQTGAVSASAPTRHATQTPTAETTRMPSRALTPATPEPAKAPAATPLSATAKRPETDAATRQAAYDAYREALSAGRKMTGTELGAMFGRSSSWGRARIAETPKLQAVS